MVFSSPISTEPVMIIFHHLFKGRRDVVGWKNHGENCFYCHVSV